MTTTVTTKLLPKRVAALSNPAGLSPVPVSIGEELEICVRCQSPFGVKPGNNASSRGAGVPRRQLQYCEPCDPLGHGNLGTFSPTLVTLTPGSVRLRETPARGMIKLATAYHSTPVHGNHDNHCTPEAGEKRDLLDDNSNLRIIPMGSALDKDLDNTSNVNKKNNIKNGSSGYRSRRPRQGGAAELETSDIAQVIPCDASMYPTYGSACLDYNRDETMDVTEKYDRNYVNRIQTDLDSEDSSACTETESTSSWLDINLSDNMAFLDKLTAECGQVTDKSNSNNEHNMRTLCCTVHCAKSSVRFCTDCDRAFCDDCDAMGHVDHATDVINAEFLLRLHKVTHEHSKVTASIAYITQCEENIITQKNQVVALLQKRRQYFHDVIERWYNKITDQLEIQLTKEMEILRQQKKRFAEHLKAAQNLVRQQTHSPSVGGMERQQTQNPTVRGMQESDGDSSEYELDTGVINELEPAVVPQGQGGLQLCLGAAPGLPRELLGKLSIERVNKPYRNQKNRPAPLLITSGQEIANFETRTPLPAPYEETDYMANGLCVSDSGQIVVTDIGRETVKVYSPQRRLVSTLNILPEDMPSSAAMLPDGRVAVACQSEVKIFRAQRPAGVYERSLWEGFLTPQCLQLHRGELLVSEFTSMERKHFTGNLGNRNEVVYVFQAETLEKVDSITWRDSQRHLVCRARYFCCQDNGDIIASDHDDHTVKVISPDGEVRRVIGGQGVAAGRFYLPAGVCTDPLGNILVADSGNHRVQVLSPRGEPLGVVVNQEEHDLTSPTDVAVNAQGHLLVLQGDGKVRIFKYTQQI